MTNSPDTSRRRRWLAPLIALGAIGIGFAAWSSEKAPRQLETAIVRLGGVGCAQSIGGTGMIVDDGLVLTSGHVVDGVDAVDVILDNGERIPGQVIHVDRLLDAAVLAIDGVEVTPIEFADADAGDRGFIGLRDPETGTEYAPFTVERRIRASTLNVGRTDEIVRRSLEIDAAIERGSSGALLFDSEGRGVGLVWAVSSAREGTAYAIRGDELPGVMAAARTNPSGPTDC